MKYSMLSDLSLCIRFFPEGIFHTFRTDPPVFHAFTSGLLVARENFRRAGAGCIVSNWLLWSPSGEWEQAIHLPTWMLPI